MTPVGVDALQTRLSLKETQSEFASRFRVTPLTVHKWETGKVERMQRIYREILADLKLSLEAKGQLIPKDVIIVFFREDAELRNALL